MQHVDQVVEDFIAYCASQSGSIDWPAIYDGMCRAAARKSFRGMGYAELREAGIYLDIFELHRTCQLVQAVRQNLEPHTGQVDTISTPEA